MNGSTIHPVHAVRSSVSSRKHLSKKLNEIFGVSSRRDTLRPLVRESKTRDGESPGLSF